MLETLYATLLLLIYATVAAGQVLGFGGWYTPGRALALTVGIALGIGWLFWRVERLTGPPRGRDAGQGPDTPPAAERWPALALNASLAALTLLVWALVLVPLVRWPVSSVARRLPWDVGLYHLPKAIDLIQKGSMWNLALPYGQYPLGWETLLALPMGLSHSPSWLGPLAALAVAWLMLGMTLLLRDRGGWPGWPAALAVGLVVGSGLWVPRFNPWSGLILMVQRGVGKNDLFAVAALFSVLYDLALPLRPGVPDRRPRFWRAALGTMVALATKPNAGVLALLLWALALVRSPVRPDRCAWVGILLLVAPGVLWAVRNLWVLGRLFSPVAAELARRAVVYHLADVGFWHPLSKTFAYVSGLTLGGVLWAWRRPAWRMPALLLAVGYGVFLFTPAGVQVDPARQWVAISWRYGLFVLLLAFLVPAAAVGPGVQRLWRTLAGVKPLAWGTSLALLLLTLGAGLTHRYLLAPASEHAHLLVDPFPQPVGAQGYRSVFDFIHCHVRRATIQIQAPLPFFYYAYDPGWTNEPVRQGEYPSGQPQAVPQPEPDHWLVCSVSWWSMKPTPTEERAAREAELQAQGWRLLYQDEACSLWANVPRSSP